MIEYGLIPNSENPITISKLLVDYTIEADPDSSVETGEEYQTLRIESLDEGAGPYIRLSLVEGKFFSVDRKTLNEILDDFNERLNCKED